MGFNESGKSGKDMKHLWSLPIISAVLFLIGTWLFFDMGETAFILYAVIYQLVLLIGNNGLSKGYFA